MTVTKQAIICVDDEEIILQSLGEQLKRHVGKDYEIELATNGEEALAIGRELIAEGINIVLIISDENMPKMSGDKLLIKFHTIYPQALKILLTGQSEINSIKKIVNTASLYRYINKPWDETDLILTVKEALKFYGQEAALIKQNNLLKQANQKLSKSLNLILATLEATDDGILVLDDRDKIITSNNKFASLWSLDNISIESNINNIYDLILSQLTKPVFCELQPNKQLKSDKCDLLNLTNGVILESSFQNQKLQGKIVGRVWRVRDVTAKEKAKAAAEHKALHDTVTQLPKRSVLTCQLTDAIAKTQGNCHMVAVMFIELDRFKIVSDTLGHKAGDRLLQEVVGRLKKCIRGEDLIARWGRDEFTLLLPKVECQESVDAIAQRILNTLKTPFQIDERSIHVNSHVGVAIYPEHGADAETILKNADTALSQAQKLKHNNYRYYDRDFSFKAKKLLTIENLLHSALERNELIVYYQPIVNVITGKIAKMEALLRWNNPKLGMVSPGVFIPIAEDNGSIIPIGEWVLKTACSQNKIWQNMGIDPVKMSVNLSVRQFQQSNLVSIVDNTLEQTHLAPSDLELEITESVTMQDTKLAKTILREMKDLGIALSMDDFGTGYSSLGYLKQFPFNTLKIDRSFIKDLHFSVEDMAIVDAIITLGQGLNLDVVAEGVETEQLKNLLVNLGCEYIQGYLFSKPLPPSAATELLKANQKYDAITISRCTH